jgi:electron transport complex protein RnfG
VVADRFKVTDDDMERDIFVGVFDGEPNTVAFEAEANGYGDKIGLMVAFNVDEDKLAGVGVTTHKETPGLGARAKEEPGFAKQFAGLSASDPIRVTQDGGNINALGGATITSRAVCTGTSNAVEIYKQLKPTLIEKLKAFSK